MLFNSLHFLFFFPVAIITYFLLPYRWRWVFLLIASYYFYMSWRAEYALLLIFATLVDYIAARKISETSDGALRKRYLVLSLMTNLGLLFSFKYFNFFNDSTRAIFDYFNIFYNVPEFRLLLPVGISFYTFQSISYVVDVYKGRVPAEKHLGIYAVYVSFWPQLVAGPIERAVHMLPQYRETHTFDYDRVKSGLIRMGWGFFKKLVIADRLSVYVNTVYNNPDDYGGGAVLLATYFFAFQIYCDFSGYSDIAIGAARVMGYSLMENFRKPYLSHSIDEFWRRWHISLSSWFRDYVYIPLGGNRVSQWRWYTNLMITFLVSGLWHGANWTFVIWGALHGFYLVLGVWTAALRPKFYAAVGLNRFPALENIFQIAVTFHLALLGWIFFRANSLPDALLLIQKMFQFPWTGLPMPTPQGVIDLWLAIYLIIGLILYEAVVKADTLEQHLLPKPALTRWAYYVVVALFILWFGVFTSSHFIYFQF